MVQKRRQGGRPVYWASASMFFPLGKRRPISHKFTVLAETPRSAAICFNRRLFRCRHVLKLMAKLLRMSHPDPDFPATRKYQHNNGIKESVKTTGPGRDQTIFVQLQGLPADFAVWRRFLFLNPRNPRNLRKSK